MPAIRINTFKFSRSIVHNNLVHPTAFFGGGEPLDSLRFSFPLARVLRLRKTQVRLEAFSEGELDTELERPAAADPVDAAAAAESTSHVA
jgi:hypothetical protein